LSTSHEAPQLLEHSKASGQCRVRYYRTLRRLVKAKASRGQKAVANLAESDAITPEDVSEAIQYRMFE
jgi:predicted ATPase with chaperone activity